MGILKSIDYSEMYKVTLTDARVIFLYTGYLPILKKRYTHQIICVSIHIV